MGLWRDELGGETTAVDSGLGCGVYSVQSVGGEVEIKEAMAGRGGSCGPAQEVGPHPGDTAELSDKSDL